ncbi:hypothetical protein KZZ52_02190 [Dactylosporangium sp. AC04546]|uniref:glycine-rich protein n=1 Tax=Dactylosporangium sp. AC04546 TaxID=2862460 RepID=UPI001EE114D0|nr:glycine-rich protein [Dactylosporangium sp. AC04546]WVK84268.1 hypothetical protein KZZ52_02190 [Dactylosporangium sp. AC04546]
MRRRNILAIAGAAVTLAAAPAAFAQPMPQAPQAPPGPSTLSAIGSEQQFTVPPGITSLHVKLVGAPGGSPADGTFTSGNGGNGGAVEADLAVTPGQVLYVLVGGDGGVEAGGFNGGGDGGVRTVNTGTQYGKGGGGGGATDIRTVSCASSCANGGDAISRASRLIVAGGGGGGGAFAQGSYASTSGAAGGNGGAAGAVVSGSGGNGAAGSDAGSGATGGSGAGGATTSAAGTEGTSIASSVAWIAATAGNAAAGGTGGANGASAGGGGGGGYFGGGGGAAGKYTSMDNEGGAGGGGGGSSWAKPGDTSNVSITADASGSPHVEFSFVPPPDIDLVIGGVDRTNGSGRTTVSPGEEFTVAGQGMLPGSTVTVEIRSTPKVLATATVTGGGTFSATVKVPSSIAAGAHTLAVRGTAADGTPVETTVPVLVSGLAVTGSPVTSMVKTGVAALVVGLILLLGLRRLRRPAA